MRNVGLEDKICHLQSIFVIFMVLKLSNSEYEVITKKIRKKKYYHIIFCNCNIQLEHFCDGVR